LHKRQSLRSIWWSSCFTFHRILSFSIEWGS
jgi:hypothetical protein